MLISSTVEGTNRETAVFETTGENVTAGLLVAEEEEDTTTVWRRWGSGGGGRRRGSG